MRYYKYIFPKSKICGLQIWFVFHVPIMIMVAIISIAGLLVILAGVNWTWTTTDEPLQFTHAIFGIVAIGLVHIQVL